MAHDHVKSPSPADAAKLGQRHTQQRDAILQVIRSSPGPMTVHEILRKARRGARRLGIATVYRTLKLLLVARQIHPVTLPDGQTRYEAADLGHHHHFHCRACRRVFDLDFCGVRLPAKSLPKGFQIDEHELTLFGTCAECSAA
jgi:Fur family ferric uptake transcriptional regulator